MNEDVRDFVRAFALGDAPKGISQWSLEYAKGYADAVRELVAEAGIDLEELDAESRRRNAQKFVL